MEKNQKKRSKKQERSIAKDVGGDTVIASGALPFWKHDVKSDDFLIEAKFTGAKSFALNARYLETLVDNSFFENRIPALV